MEPIRSPRNRAVVEAGRLHRVLDRRRAGKTLIEGPHLLDEALGAGVEVERTFHLPDDPEANRWPSATPVDQAVLEKLAGTESPRGPIAVIAIPPPHPIPTDRSVIVLWGVADPGNVGTIIRSAAAFGLGVAVGPFTADPWAPKVLRAGAGGHFRTPLSTVASPADLAGLRVAATVPSGGIAPARLERGVWAVLIGSEAHGLDPALVAHATVGVTIPMPGETESLNAAVAASIIAYALVIGSGASPSDH
jgi:TrmH family RNA methyltransferase